MTELVQIANDPTSTSDDIDAARVRLRRCHSETGHDATGTAYDAGLRSAMMTHLNMCESARRDPVTLAMARSSEETLALKTQATAIYAGFDDIQDLSPILRQRVADVLHAHADLSDAMREHGDRSVLVLQGLQGGAFTKNCHRTVIGDETDWRDAGRRHWALSLTTASHDDDDPACEAAHAELDTLRALIPRLAAGQSREYLLGLIEEIESFAWHGL